MHYVYILYSETASKFYVGESAFPQDRLAEHNRGKYDGASTKMANDWEIKLLITCSCRKDALKIENHIKSMKSSKFLQSLCNNTDFFSRFKEIVVEKYAIKID